MDTNWPVFLLGLFAIAIGIALIVKREPFAKLMATHQRASLGKIGERTAKSATPGNVLFPGIGAILTGLLMAGFGVFGVDM